MHIDCSDVFNAAIDDLIVSSLAAFMASKSYVMLLYICYCAVANLKRYFYPHLSFLSFGTNLFLKGAFWVKGYYIEVNCITPSLC